MIDWSRSHQTLLSLWLFYNGCLQRAQTFQNFFILLCSLPNIFIKHWTRPDLALCDFLLFLRIEMDNEWHHFEKVEEGKEKNKDGAYNHTDRQVWKMFTTMATQIREVYWVKKISWRWYGCIVNKIKRTTIIKKLQLFLAPLKQPIKPFFQ